MKPSLTALLSLLLFGTLFTGCQGGGLGNSVNIWRRPDYFGAPKKSVAVAVLAYRAETRVHLENILVTKLRQQGVDARTTYPVIDTQTIISNKPAAVERAKSLGVQAILAVSMVDRDTLKAVHISTSNSSEGLEPWQNWFEFFSVTSAFATHPEMARPGNEIGAMATFFECPSGHLLWSATFTHLVSNSSSQDDYIAGALVAKLHSAALIP